MTRSAKGSIEAPGRNVAAKAGLNRVVLDAGFGLLEHMILAKAEEAGPTLRARVVGEGVSFALRAVLVTMPMSTPRW
ncbi:MAG TPA: hypothetical protein VNG31_02085 [Candidatus Baltobacteraceae bacterium]|nr:hypothetical protein [Candidatus Baltobacteraceae bacterium]